MNIEYYNPISEDEKKEKKLYTERAFVGVDKGIERIKEIEAGEIEKIELSETEREQILKDEDKMGERLENIFDIKINTTTFYPEYFLTNKGRAEFRFCTGFDIEAEDVGAVERFLYRYRGALENIDSKLLDNLSGKSKEFSENQLFEQLKTTMDEDGGISIDGAANPTRISILLNPEEALEKIIGMREFKRSLREIQEKECPDNASENFKLVKEKIGALYRKRVNILITDLLSHAVRVKKMSESIGVENLTSEEQDLLKQFPGMSEFVKTFARYDKFVYGVSEQFDENGNSIQVGDELERYADDMEEKYIKNEISKRSKAEEKGIDYEKLAKTWDVKKEIFVNVAEKCLDAYDQKSIEPAVTFNSKRKGPAGDNKWQFVVNERYRTMSVSQKLKIIKAPVRDRSMEELFVSMLGHEYTHFVQTLNQENIPLRLYKKVYGDRRLALSEGGAMMMQDRVSRELFGYGSYPIAGYVRAMIEKQKGGTYVDCVKAFYESSLKSLRADDAVNKLAPEVFKKRAEKALEVACRSAKRLFSPGEEYDARNPILTGSKDTIYLEQVIAMERLQESGMEKYAFILGLNLDSMAELMEMNFLDDKKIQLPKEDFIKKTWEELKGDYVLNKEV